MKNFFMEKTMPVTLMFLDADSGIMDCASYEISFTMVTEMASAAELSEQKLKQHISLTKLLTLIEAVVDQSMVITASTEDFHTVTQFNNNVIVLPDITEAMLTMALHSKFNAVVHTDTFVDCVRLKNTRDDVSYEYLQTDKEYTDLPAMSEWLGDLSYWQKPWWQRADISTLDRQAATPEEHELWCKTREKTDVDELNTQVFRDIEDQITLMFNSGRSAPGDKQGELIEVDFQNKYQT